jgi:phenylacetate-coenzyme A ligase PaaK-like adenylate-forming protein
LAPPNFLGRAKRLLAQNKGSTDALIGGRRGLHIESKDENLFLRSMKEAFAYHYLASPPFQALCADVGFYPWSLRRSEQIPDIPYFFVTALKHHSVSSVKEQDVALTLRSSGTTGQTSAIVLDRTSLRRIRRIVHHIYDDLGMRDQRRTNYLCFTYDPEVAKDVGTAYSDKLLTGLTKVQDVFYTIEWNEQKKDWHLDSRRVEEAMDRFEASGRPFRLLGFPAHTWDVLNEVVARRGKAYKFGPLSYVITGGGWKGFDGRAIPKPEFREGVARALGIPRDNVRDLYGMVEHGVPYCECEKHRMHVPRYSRVYARDPATLQLLDYGQTGLLQFVTSYHHSYPAISLLTTDYGHVLKNCPCGRPSPVLVLEGRAGLTKHKGCAINALKVRADV